MAKKMFTFSTKEVDTNLIILARKLLPEDAKKGIKAGLNELRRDSFTKKPQAPFKTGALRASAKVMDIQIKRTLIGGKVVFNIKYAARLHEMEKYKKPTRKKGVMSPGPKFLESKVTKYRKKYFEIMSDSLKRRFKAAGGV